MHMHMTKNEENYVSTVIFKERGGGVETVLDAI